MVQRGLKMVWSLVNQVLCVLYIHTFYFFPKRKQAKKDQYHRLTKFFLWESWCSACPGSSACRQIFRFLLSKDFSNSIGHRRSKKWSWLDLRLWALGWRLVCRGLAQSIKLPVVGILYLSSWNFAFVLLVFCILSSSPSWGRRPELCPLYLICKVDAQVMARDGAPRYIWMDNVTSTLCNLLWFDTYFISFRGGEKCNKVSSKAMCTIL